MASVSISSRLRCKPLAQRDPTFQRSGYRHYRSTLQGGNSADNMHIVEQWGAPVVLMNNGDSIPSLRRSIRCVGSTSALRNPECEHRRIRSSEAFRGRPANRLHPDNLLSLCLVKFRTKCLVSFQCNPVTLSSTVAQQSGLSESWLFASRTWKRIPAYAALPESTLVRWQLSCRPAA